MTNGRMVGLVAAAALGGLLAGRIAERPVVRAPAVDAVDPERLRTSDVSEPEPPAPLRPPTPERPARPAAATPSEPLRAVATERITVDVHPNDPSIGPDDAKVTIVEFTDLLCSFCRRAKPTTSRIMDTYGPDVRLVFKHNPLRKNKGSALAHEAAAEAHAQGRFWDFHDRVFASGSAERAELEGHAEAIGLDMGRFRAALDAGLHSAIVERDRAQARALGVIGAPTFFVNGRAIRGAHPFETFKRVIDEDLGRSP